MQTNRITQKKKKKNNAYYIKRGSHARQKVDRGGTQKDARVGVAVGVVPRRRAHAAGDGDVAVAVQRAHDSVVAKVGHIEPLRGVAAERDRDGEANDVLRVDLGVRDLAANWARNNNHLRHGERSTRKKHRAAVCEKAKTYPKNKKRAHGLFIPQAPRALLFPIEKLRTNQNRYALQTVVQANSVLVKF
jgi:hypothetical protein